jgi:hypothetical protein
LQVDGVGIDLMGCEPRTLSNPACRISSYFTVRPGVLMRIKAKLGSMVFWSRIVTSAKPLLLLEVMGRPAVARLPAPHFLRRLLRSEPPLMTDIVQPAEKEAEDLTIGLRAIRAIHAMHHDLMLIHNPTYWYLNGQLREPAVQPLAASLKDDGLEITRMMKYLPAAAKERDWFSGTTCPMMGIGAISGRKCMGSRSTTPCASTCSVMPADLDDRLAADRTKRHTKRVRHSRPKSDEDTMVQFNGADLCEGRHDRQGRHDLSLERLGDLYGPDAECQHEFDDLGLLKTKRELRDLSQRHPGTCSAFVQDRRRVGRNRTEKYVIDHSMRVCVSPNFSTIGAI